MKEIKTLEENQINLHKIRLTRDNFDDNYVVQNTTDFFDEGTNFFESNQNQNRLFLHPSTPM